MKIFISWSGEKSNKIAETLRDWFEQMLQSTEPWISTSIDKGRKWSEEISSRLEESKIGIICLTRENLEAPWILFEAGAISKSSDSYVCTFLTDISSPTEITGPLSSFQATKFVKNDLLKLCKTINKRIKDDKSGKSLSDKALEELFEMFWPKLEKNIKKILETEINKTESHIRTDRELLEETIEGIRFLKTKINTLWSKKEIEEVVDHYVKIFINQKSIDEYQIIDEPHLSEFSAKLENNPIIRKLFPTREIFYDFMNDKYGLPF